jgi:proteasome activator subunit 4
MLRPCPYTCSSDAIAKILVYSMAVDGEERDDTNQKGYKAGSRALDSLDRLITSTESFFHPSNSGPWTSLVSLCCLGKILCADV